MSLTHPTEGFTHRRRRRWLKIPLPLWVVALGLVAAFLSDTVLARFVGLRVTYLGWILPLLGSLAVVFQVGFERIRFPILLWIPWSLWVLIYLLQSDAPNVLQRSIMLLTPLAVGAACSTVRMDLALLAKGAQWIDRFMWVFLLAVGISTGLVTGQLYGATGFAAGAITASLLAVWYAGKYVTFRNRRDLLIWAFLAAVPVLANTRTGMVAVAMTLPLTLVPWPVKKRLIAVVILAVSGLLVFQTERIQNKMFHGGQGTLQDAVTGLIDTLTGAEELSSDFATSGRAAMNRALVRGVQNAYWFGHGANTTEAIAVEIAGVTHPHNDWLRLQYEYGTLGMVLFGLTMLVQALHAFWWARRLHYGAALLLYVGAGAFLPMAVFMFADNVILYAAWFGNLHFAFLGLGYAAMRDRAWFKPPLSRASV